MKKTANKAINKSTKKTQSIRQVKNVKTLVPIKVIKKKSNKKVSGKVLTNNDTLKKNNKKMSVKYYLTDLSKCRKALNTILNNFNQYSEKDIPRIRAQGYLINSVISCFQIEKSISIEERLDAIEENMKYGKIVDEGKGALL